MKVNGKLHAPATLSPEEIAPGTHWSGGWVGYRFGLDAVEKRKILQCRESNPGRPAHSLSLYRFCYPDSPQLLLTATITITATYCYYYYYTSTITTTTVATTTIITIIILLLYCAAIYHVITNYCCSREQYFPKIRKTQKQQPLPTRAGEM
jgi:hypothetical protein